MASVIQSTLSHIYQSDLIFRFLYETHSNKSQTWKSIVIIFGVIFSSYYDQIKPFHIQKCQYVDVRSRTSRSIWLASS